MTVLGDQEVKTASTLSPKYEAGYSHMHRKEVQRQKEGPAGSAVDKS